MRFADWYQRVVTRAFSSSIQFATTWRVGGAAGSSLIISSDPSGKTSKLARPLAESPVGTTRGGPMLPSGFTVTLTT